MDDATHSDHGQAAVLDLNEAAAGESCGVLAAAKGIKAEIASLAALREHVAGGHLEVVREELDGTDGEEHLPEARRGNDEEVIEGSGAVLELGKSDSLLDNHAGEGEHANTAVLELSLAKPLEVEVVGEANGVKANIAREGAIESRGALKEGQGVVLHA